MSRGRWHVVAAVFAMFLGTMAAAFNVGSGSSSGGGALPQFNPLACNLYDQYPSACASVANCTYCCTTQQCLPSSDAQNLCSEPGALMERGDNATNCDELCWRRILPTANSAARCTACLQRSWCLFCPADSNCYSERGFECAMSMTNDCATAWGDDSSSDDNSATQQILPYLIWACVGLGGLCIVVPLARFCLGRIHSHIEQRRDAERRRQFRETLAARESAGRPRDPSASATSDERQPLLGATEEPAPPAALASSLVEPHNEDGDDDKEHVVKASSPSAQSLADEDACQLCLERLANVVYLPCYHSYCCEECSSKLRPSHRRSEGNAVSCPFCRQRIRAMVSLAPMPDVISSRFRRPTKEPK